MVEDLIADSCLIFPFAKSNGNAISALVASLDIHPKLKDLEILLPDLKDIPDDLSSRISDYDNIILAFSVYTTQLSTISTLIDKYRQRLKHKRLLVVCGGPHPIGDPFSMLYNGADIVCTGEGEVVFRDIILTFLHDGEFEDVKGIAFFGDNQKMIKTAKPKPIDLSEFPPFSTKHQLYRPLEITRGCAWKCRFCQVRSRGGVPVRHRPIEQVINYVKKTVEYFSDRRPDIRFISPNALSYGSTDGVNLQLNKVENLLGGIREIIGDEGNIYFGSFPAEVRPETITPESVKLLKKYSDSKTIILGGQSGSEKVLEYVDRGHGTEETLRATKLLVDAGFRVDVDVIFGLPGEDEEDVDATIEFMQKLIDMGAYIHSHTFLPLVGTPYANEEAGEIHPKYEKFIRSESNLIRGQHVKQEKEAAEMEQRRKEERKVKHEFNTVRKLDQ